MTLSHDGVRLIVECQINQQEHDQRCQAGTGALLDTRSLAALWELPEGIEIDRRCLPEWCNTVLGDLPETLVRRRETTFTRVTSPVLAVHNVVATGAPWRRAASALGAFVTVARRWALVPEVTDVMGLEAPMWGIGLLVDWGIDLHPVRDAARPSLELGPYQWWLSERMYQAWLGQPIAEPTRQPVS